MAARLPRQEVRPSLASSTHSERDERPRSEVQNEDCQLFACAVLRDQDRNWGRCSHTAPGTNGSARSADDRVGSVSAREIW